MDLNMRQGLPILYHSICTHVDSGSVKIFLTMDQRDPLVTKLRSLYLLCRVGTARQQLVAELPQVGGEQSSGISHKGETISTACSCIYKVDS